MAVHCDERQKDTQGRIKSGRILVEGHFHNLHTRRDGSMSERKVRKDRSTVSSAQPRPGERPHGADRYKSPSSKGT